ncbi:MAG: hypothetical protein KBT29_04635 [Prevotellaceae bacterium]|nr:hypothetical protein [Candidatus Minthosoma caballi]
MKKCLLFIIIALLVGCTKTNVAPIAEEDSELVTLLNELDECVGSADRENCFRLYAQIAAEYEKKNMTELQKLYQQKMLEEAKAIGEDDSARGCRYAAEALQQLATSYMVEGQLDSASVCANQAYHIAPKDTLDFRAQTLLLLAQIHLMAGNGDSVGYFVKKAESIYPDVAETELYRITHAYGLDLQGDNDALMALLPSYIFKCSIHGKAELTRLLMFHHEGARQWREAYEDAKSLMDITDSIATAESSENMARIHALQHERQMEHQRAEREAERARLYIVIIVALLLLLAASVVGLFYRRKARIAHAHELEAMRLSEIAQANESEVREENIKLQKLYYEHLYAIILPILNAHRGKSGHINLEESSWELIEKNTDMVLPGFTSRLRKQHSALTAEDIRFCCLLMMQVPNAVLADIYGIAPSSIAVRKQRMKKKLDSDVQNQTIENYLNQYII